MALARVAPPSTVVRTPVRVFWKAGFSWLAARISRHCTRGRPASIMTENCRKKMAMSLVLTLFMPKARHGKFFALFPDGSWRDAFAPQLAGQRLFVDRSPLATDLLTGLILSRKCENWHGKPLLAAIRSSPAVVPAFKTAFPPHRFYRWRRQLRPLPIPAPPLNACRVRRPSPGPAAGYDSDPRRG